MEIQYTTKEEIIEAGRQRTFEFPIEGRKVISGGVRVKASNVYDVLTTESFPLKEDTWLFAIINKGNEDRTIELHVISLTGDTPSIVIHLTN